MILLHPCTSCPNGLTEHRNATCVRCKAEFEATFNPNDRPATTPRHTRRSGWWHLWWGFTHPFGPRSQA